MSESFGFHLHQVDGLARRGELQTPHGVVQTPAFMPVGTHGTVKALTHRELSEVGAKMILANTYHLHLRPGDELIARAGGLHRFIGWPGPILTDSGGYQIFSLSNQRMVSEKGVHFRSHLDGSSYFLTPERATEIQARLGADIAMAFDECTPYPVSIAEADRSMNLTLQWARRSRERFLEIQESRSPLRTNPGQVQFGIVQGSVFPMLREESVRETLNIGFDAYAVGGLSVGEDNAVMHEIGQYTVALLPWDRPRYLMGVGKPGDLVEMVACGFDLFDCVLPTRNARNGQLFTQTGPINIKGARYAEDQKPPDVECECYTCQNFTRAYLRHLYLANEMTAATLNTLHNLHFYLDTMRRISEAIMLGSFESFRQDFHKTFSHRE